MKDVFRLNLCAFSIYTNIYVVVKSWLLFSFSGDSERLVKIAFPFLINLTFEEKS